LAALEVLDGEIRVAFRKRAFDLTELVLRGVVEGAVHREPSAAAPTVANDEKEIRLTACPREKPI